MITALMLYLLVPPCNGHCSWQEEEKVSSLPRQDLLEGEDFEPRPCTSLAPLQRQDWASTKKGQDRAERKGEQIVIVANMLNVPATSPGRAAPAET